MPMFALVVRLDCGDEAAATRFDKLTAEVFDQITTKEPGTLIYATHSVEGEPRSEQHACRCMALGGPDAPEVVLSVESSLGSPPLRP
jgi:hypothetical protein